MQTIDWLIILVYCTASLAIGLYFTRKAASNVRSYFAADGGLNWFLAGTSMAATAFSSDTPLLITGIVRQKGIWGNWEVWALGISTMAAVFIFSKLWKRTGVLTEVEFTELRYSGRSASFLRGFKAIYWGVLYNSFIMGAWPITGLTKVMQSVTDWSKWQSIVFCLGITAVYASLSGYWGVIFTDLFQFVIAMGGAFLLAIYAVKACGGVEQLVTQLNVSDKLHFIPPKLDNDENLLAGPFGWFLSLLLIQWWAWKNSDGGGIIVQRIASCKNEKQAIYATLWFNIAQYALRSWPWIITALASLILLPDLQDHESAYPQLIKQLLPPGLIGLMIASFFAAFMSTMSTHLNWGASYFVNDFYKRFIVPHASDKHYVAAARITSVCLAVTAGAVALATESIGQVFTFVLNLTAGIGPVILMRWFWQRINAWSELSAMAASLPLLMLRGHFFAVTGIPSYPLFELLYMVLGCALCWIPVTLCTAPVDAAHLSAFQKKVNPPGLWGGATSFSLNGWHYDFMLWVLSVAALTLLTAGPLKWFLGSEISGIWMTVTSILLWVGIAFGLRKRRG